MLTIGIHGEQSQLVTNENTAKTMGSGTLDVFATPALVALAEKTCWMSIASELDAGCGSVGTKLELEHTAPTPVGMTVRATATVTGVSENGKLITFRVEASDDWGPIGEGTHTRAIIANERFLQKCNSKLTERK